MSVSFDKKYLLIPLLLLVLTCNYAIYHVNLPFQIDQSEMSWVVVGSLFDLIIVVPIMLLVMTKKGNLSWTRMITYFAIGAVAARLIIPMIYFEPFRYVTYSALAMEAVILFIEIWIVFLLFWRLPKIIKAVKQTNLSPLFSLQHIISEKISNHVIIRLLAFEITVFYYAFAAWRKPVPTGDHIITLHKNTSMIAVNIMIIHAIVFETIGLHYWLHQKSPIVSIILLLLNVYSIILFVADIQALRLNPLTFKNGNIYLSLGLMKKMIIPFDKITNVQWDNLPEKIDTETTIDFIARDLETPKTHCIIELAEPIDTMLAFGIKKKYEKVAIHVDHPEELSKLIQTSICK